MKFDFDTYEFAGLIAPGSVVLLAVAMLYPQLMHSFDPAIVIAAGVVGAYVLGHLVAAIGNLVQPIFGAFGAPRLKDLDLKRWQATKRSYLSSTQEDALESRANTMLTGSFADLVEHGLLEKQMYLALADKSHRRRLETFNGLYNLSRGLAVSFCFALVLCLMAGRYAGALLCAATAALAVYRTRKFNHIYSVELIQRFLSLK